MSDAPARCQRDGFAALADSLTDPYRLSQGVSPGDHDGNAHEKERHQDEVEVAHDNRIVPPITG